MPPTNNTGRLIRAAAGALIVLLLAGTLWLNLLAVFVCAMGTYAIYTRLLQSLRARMRDHLAIAVAVLVTVLVLSGTALALTEAVETFALPVAGLPALLDLLADTLDRLRASLPAWLSARLPASTADLQHSAGDWLRAHAANLQRWGVGALRMGAHVLIGLVIGLLAAFERHPRPRSPGANALRDSAHNLSVAFRVVVSAQLRIALVNTALTALFLLVLLPLGGVHLPLAIPLIALTFCTGLIPIVGNLASNAALVLVALTVGAGVAAVALVFLAAIHKLEYLLNAHFVSSGTHVPASWLLAAMVAFEAAFGLPGLFAAPIFCAWLFAELREAGVIG